jgi:hypothetical protein
MERAVHLMPPPLRRSFDFSSTASLIPPVRPVPSRGLVRAGHPAPGWGLMPTPAPASRLRWLGFPSPPISRRRHIRNSSDSHSSTTKAQTWPRVLEVTLHPARRHEWQPASPLQCPHWRHDGSRRVQHSTLSVSCVCRGDRLVPHNAEVANVSAPSRAGRTPSGGAPEGLLQLTRPASAPSSRSLRPTSSCTGTQRVPSRRPASASRRPPPPPSSKGIGTLRAGIFANTFVACPCWPPRPLATSWRSPASPPFAALRASSSRWWVSTAEVAVSTFGAPEVAKAMHPHTAFVAFLRFGEAIVPPFSFLASVTKA